MESNLLQSAFLMADRAITVSSVTHTKIHQGNYWFTSLTGAIGASSWIMVQMNTPTSATGEFQIDLIMANHSAGLAELTILEAPTTMVTGSSTQTFVNRNRNSTKTTPLVSYSNPTGVSLSATATSTQATIITSFQFGTTGASGQGGGGMPGGFSIEWPLKYNTTYVIKLMDKTGNAGNGSLRIFGYLSTNYGIT